MRLFITAYNTGYPIRELNKMYWRFYDSKTTSVEMASEVELRGIEPLYPNVEYGFLTVR